MENKPLVSLVVPTKNRYPYLVKLIELLETFNFGPEFELVIQDNNEDNSKFLEYLKNKNIPYLRYYYDNTPMPIGPNCDNAIRKSKGEYVCFIGDDDLVTENFMPCVSWMVKNNIECVFPKRIMYFWPDYCDSGNERSAVHHEPFTDNITFIDTKQALEGVMRAGCIYPGKLPMIYHGIVKRSVLEKIWDKCGTLFPGASPDIASGVSLSMVIDKYATFSFPIIIAGNSRTGGGGQRVIKHNAVEDISKIPFLPKNIGEVWCPRVPRIWSNATIWSESAIEALREWGRTDLIDKINYEALYEHFAINYFYFRKYSFALTKNKTKLALLTARGLVILYSKNAIKYILHKLHLHIRNTRIIVEGINDSRQLCDHFKKEGYYFCSHFQ